MFTNEQHQCHAMDSNNNKLCNRIWKYIFKLKNNNNYSEFRCIPAKNPDVCTPLDFCFCIIDRYSGGHIYIFTYTNIIKLIYYVDNYVL